MKPHQRFAQLDQVCEIIAGQSPPSESYNDKGEGLPFFQGKADFGLLTPIVRSWCSEPQKISIPNDILISVRAPVGPTNINNVTSCIGRGLSAIRCSNAILNKYLLHYLRHNETKIADMGTGSTFKAITQKELKKIQIPLLPLAEQEKIARILDVADDLRQKDQQLINHYTALGQALFIEMFGDPVTNPMGWDEEKLSKLATFENGDRSSNYPSGDDIKDTGILFLSTKNISNGYFDLNFTQFISEQKFSNLSRGKAKKNDLLITLRGTLGSCCIFDCEFDTAFINAQMMIIRAVSNVSPTFLHALITSNPVFQQLQDLGRGAAIPQLTATQMSNLCVISPPIQLQTQFAERITLIEAQKRQAQASLAYSQALFDSLLHRAFTGELTQ